MTLHMLSQYLLTFHRLPMPGIGMLMLKRQPARLQILEKQIDAGGYVIEWSRDVHNDDHLVRWLANQLNQSVAEATQSFQCYINKLIAYLNTGNKIEWGYLGILEKKGDEQMYFNGSVIHIPGNVPVLAEKVIRKKAGHQVLVGDQTFSADDMQHKLRKTPVKIRRHSIIISAAVILLAIFTMIYLFVTEKRFIHSHQQQPSIKVQTPSPAYKILSNDE